MSRHAALTLLLIPLLSACASNAPAESPPPPTENTVPHTIRITLTSIPVNDQEAALRFYTEKLGFEKRHDIPLGGEHRWLTVTSPAGVEGVELLLEPNAHPATKTFQETIRADGIPITQFAVGDIHAEHERLTAAGVTFRAPPAQMGEVWVAILDDTVGNWISLVQQ